MFFRKQCYVQHSECVVTEHEAACECKKGFHGNGTESCVPDGFTEEENGKTKSALLNFIKLN